MNINFKFLLCGVAVWLFPQYAAAQCAETDCLKLGYTKLEKCDNGLKCPFGEYWACPKEETAVLGQCSGYAKNCKIADILNSDGTCTTNKESGKTPIGVVVYISSGTDKCGYAMTATPVKEDIKWGGDGTDISLLPNYTTWTLAIKDFDVSGNMTKIIQASKGNSNAYPAAYAALNYAPSVVLTSKGKWALPTAGVLNSLYINLNDINNTISKLGGTQLTKDNEHIWSSSEWSDGRAWFFCTNEGAKIGGLATNLLYDYYNGHVVRPVLAF